MSRRRMEREGVVLTATNTLMAELAQDWSRPEGGQLLGILFKTYFHPSPNKALHRTVVPARSLTQAQFRWAAKQGRQVGNFARGNLPS